MWLGGAARTNGFPTVGSTLVSSGGFLARIDPAPPAAQPGVPRIDAIYNGASYAIGDVISAGEIVTLTGAELASDGQSALGAPLPIMLSDTAVTVGGVPAPLYYVSPAQINFQVPGSVPVGAADLTVNRKGTITTRSTRVIAERPGIFFVNGVPAITHASDFSLVTQQNPARPGEYLAIFGTGLGPTTPARWTLEQLPQVSRRLPQLTSSWPSVAANST